MKNLLKNSLDMSIEDEHESIRSKRPLLILENYFLIRRWTIDNVSYILVTY